MADTNTPTKLPVFSTANAMSLLWRKAAPELHTHELEWFATQAAAQIFIDTNALSEVLSDIGALIGGDDGDSGAFMTPDSTSNLMFSLSSQLSTINGLAEIAADANYRVRESLKGQP